jgi:hypothetical protein
MHAGKDAALWCLEKTIAPLFKENNMLTKPAKSRRKKKGAQVLRFRKNHTVDTATHTIVATATMATVA